METVTGYVTGINGNLANVSFDGAVHKNEVAYILVDGKRLKGEVIRINNGVASMQIYEMSNGIKVGDQVEFTGELMSVELGPGLLTQVFDGLQNPLPDLAEQCGFFLERGVYLDPIPDRDWEFTPSVAVGDSVEAGDSIGSVPEGLFKHEIMVPFTLKGSDWTVKSIKEKGSYNVRLSLPKKLKEYMAHTYDIRAAYLYLKNPVFSNMDIIKQIKIYPPANDGTSRILVIYEVEDVLPEEDNGHYLSIDLGLHNLMTCYDNAGKTFIIGREYLSLSYFYNKEIARVQSQWGRIQAAREMEDPKTSKHLQKLYRKKNNCIKDYIHKMTRYITNYCVKNDIHTVVIGDIKGIRKERNLGRKTNQKLHSLPYARIYMQLEYKLKMKGICLIRQEESYSSQCPPQSEEVSHIYAEKRNRKKRGIYIVDTVIYNADAVGAYNILRKYHAVSGKEIDMPVTGLSSTKTIKVAV